MARYPTPSELLDEAVAVAGLDDFGPGDFREGLGVLLASIEADADLSPEADAAVIGVLRNRLVNRLRVEQWYRDHPEIEDVAIAGPAHVIGLPRTGTTALGSMLSLDPQFRSLRMWEQRSPCPPPVLGEETDDPRRLAYVAEVDALSAEERAKHLYEVDATVEGQRRARHGVPRPAVHAARLRLPPLVAGVGLRRHLRLPPPWASCSGRGGRLRCGCSSAASQVPPRPDRAAYPDARFVFTHATR